jgi:hypothetical protein
MTDPRLKRTKFAARAATLADQFQNAVEEYPVGVHHGVMTAPESSTGGGVQALQHIRLVPREGEGRTYVVGNANRVERFAEVRTLEYLDRVSQERFGEPTGFNPVEYAQFVAAAEQFLEMFGLSVTRATHPPSLRPPPPEPRQFVVSKLAIVAIVIWCMALVAIGLAIGVAMKKGH